MVDRIRQLLAWQQLSPTQFADFIGVGRPVISHILSERNKPSLDVVQRIIAAFPTVSMPWLLSGSGEMLVTASQPPTPVPAAAAAIAPPVAPLAPTPAEVSSLAPKKAPTSGVTAPLVEAPAATTAPPRRPPMLQAPPLARFVANKPPAARPVEVETMPFPAAPTSAGLRSPVDIPTDTISNAAALPAVSTSQAFVVAPSPTITEPEVASPPARSLIAPAIPGDAAEMLPLLAEPGKAIRRIVIFYRDGSFADYLPEG